MKTSDVFMRAEMMISRLIIKLLKIQDSDKNRIKKMMGKDKEIQ